MTAPVSVATVAASATMPTRPGMRGARARLLAAAIDLFAARGYHGVSVRDLTARMGAQPSSLYAHYSSKADLFADLAYIANESIRDRLRNALLRSDNNPAAQMSALVHSYVSFHTEFPLLATLGHNDLHVLTGPQLHRVAAVRKEGVDLMQAVIERGNDEGIFHCAEPLLAVAAIAGMGIRIASWYRPPGSADPGDGYTSEVQHWMPKDFTVEQIADTFTDYALSLLHCHGRSASLDPTLNST
jgi:AcrR family transcriptional regulator